jgi:hypothetical protein
MSDQAQAGSVTEQQAAPPAGAPAEPAAPAANGSPQEGDNPFSGLQDEGARKWVETKGYKSVADVVGAAHSLEQRLGTVVTVPAPDAPKDEWDKFVAKLPEERRPIEAPDVLDFKRPDDLPAELPYNDELANAAKPWMHEAGLTKGQSQAIHDKFAGWMADQTKAQLAEVAKSVEKTHDDLVKDWGPIDSEGFKSKLAVADRAMKKLGLVDAYKAKGILLDDGSLTDPQIARAFEAIGSTMFKDDVIGAGDMIAGGNPFKRDAKGERNLGAISALVKSDPERAKRLAREAGEDPTRWIMSNPL